MLRGINMRLNKRATIGLGAIIGIFAFLLIYGMTPLDVTNDNWIMSGYNEGDIIQHYAGWVEYRASDWAFPIGLATNMAYGDGTVITYTDSIPWVAIVSKIFSNILPDTFQYFGVYTLCCFILQGIAAALLMLRKTDNPIFIFLGTIPFCFSPIFLERAFRHTALGSQWLILFSIYYYLEIRRKIADGVKVRYPVAFCILGVLAIGIHPYFLPMVMIFVLLICLELCKSKGMRQGICWLTMHFVVIYLVGILLGALGHGVPISRADYGFFSINLNAIFNPKSCGGYKWSHILPTQPQILGNYDGFNYLGLGIILLLIIVLSIGIIFYKNKSRSVLKRNLTYLFAMIFLLCFAVTNVITFQDKILLTIPIPERVVKLCGIFRASSRMFYPVYYSIYIFVIYRLYDWNRRIGKNLVIGLLGIVVAIQMFDLSSVVLKKHMEMKEKSNYTSILDDPVLNRVKKIKYIAGVDGFEGDYRPIAVWAGKKNVITLFSVANSGYYPNSWKYTEESFNKLLQGNKIESTIYFTTIEKDAQQWCEQNNNMFVHENSGIFFVIPKQDATQE